MKGLLLVALVALVSEIVAQRTVFPRATGTGNFQAGVAKINATMPIGGPLAGYNHGPRRVPKWPIPEFREYTTFMMPSVGMIDPTWSKALVIDNGEERFAFCTLDGIGSDSTLNKLAISIAASKGFSVPIEKVVFSSSHSHSGPGAVSPEKLWELAPATDLMVPSLQLLMATHMADALVAAEQNLAPAQMDIGIGYLVGVTQNRRAPNPWLQKGTIDPHLGVFRVDDMEGNPLATVWNFAIHGVCYGPENMKSSGDIMGRANELIEDAVGGVSLFINADAGDIDPADGMCNGGNETSNAFVGSPLMADAVVATRATLTPSDTITMQAANNYVDFGPTDLNITLARFNNCSTGGELDVCGICKVLGCDANIHLADDWVEDQPRFTGFTFVINDVSTVLVTMPGEALVELGWWIRNDTQDLGFNQTILAGYSNNHMGYFATPNEYDWGGYESQLTMWGITTAAQIRAGCYSVSSPLKPAQSTPVIAMPLIDPPVHKHAKNRN